MRKPNIHFTIVTTRNLRKSDFSFALKIAQWCGDIEPIGD
jgi:hypothetical protein